MQSEQLATLVRDSLEDSKAQDLVVMDVRGKTTITDFIVVATGTSNRHVQAVAERLVERVKQARGEMLGIEGKESGEWVLMDFGDAVVHVMQAETRAFYNLEQLWQTEHKALTGQDADARDAG